MSCSEIRPLLSELADSSLSGEARARVTGHLEGCEACRAAFADIRRIRQEARSLPKAVPSPELWEKVRARVEAERRGADVVSIRPHRRWFPGTTGAWAMGAAAAVLLVALSTGLVMMMRGSQAPATRSASSNPVAQQPGAPATAAAHGSHADLVQSIEMEMQQADQHYEKALAGLEQVAREGQGSLDPRTAAVLQKNLGVLDQAIKESRSALQQQPSSEMARSSLFEALSRKVQLLQDTVALINEMRKGNQAGAAQIVSANKG